MHGKALVVDESNCANDAQLHFHSAIDETHVDDLIDILPWTTEKFHR